jgi:hypothetical protein
MKSHTLVNILKLPSCAMIVDGNKQISFLLKVKKQVVGN